MSFLTKLNKRSEAQEEHAEVERRLSMQEKKVKIHEYRLKRLELELGILTQYNGEEHLA